MSDIDIRTIVKKKYSEIARQSDGSNSQSCCCGPAADCCGTDYTIFSESYVELQGYEKDADLGLGCGIPTEFAAIEPGHHVLDLGSGAGNDCFVARVIVGEAGSVTGLEFSEEMLAKARKNVSKLGYLNVHFVAGDIEDMPFEDDRFDVVISNCVLNLVPDKGRAFAELLRVLKPGGHFCVSDVVIKGELPEKLRADAEMYAGCVSGAMQLEDYLGVITRAGFANIQIHKQRVIQVPGEILKPYLDDHEMNAFLTGHIGIFSVTVSAAKQ